VDGSVRHRTDGASSVTYRHGRVDTPETGLRIEAVGPCTYRLVGELDMATADLLRETLGPVAAAGSGLRLELEDLTFMDSTGMGALIHLARSFARPGPIALVRPSPAVLRILELAGILQLDLFEVE
jgi:anti-anti-sigma factor